jgi:hypothetical protein
MEIDFWTSKISLIKQQNRGAETLKVETTANSGSMRGW